MNIDEYIEEVAIQTKYSAPYLKSYLTECQKNIRMKLRDDEKIDLINQKAGITSLRNLRADALKRQERKQVLKDQARNGLTMIVLLLWSLVSYSQVKLKQIQHSEQENQIIITDDNGRPYYFFLDSLGVGYGITSQIYADSNTIYHVFNRDTTAIVLNICPGSSPGTGGGGLGGMGCNPKTISEFNSVSNIINIALDNGTLKTPALTNSISSQNLSDCSELKGFYDVSAKFRIAGAQVATYILRIKAAIDSGPSNTIIEKLIYSNVGDYEQDFLLNTKGAFDVPALSAKNISFTSEVEIVDLGVISNDIPEWSEIEISALIFASSNTN